MKKHRNFFALPSAALAFWIGQGFAADGLDSWVWRNPLPEPAYLNGAVYADGQFVAVGLGGTVMNSTNGIQWTRQTLGSRECFRSLAYGNGLFVAVGFEPAQQGMIFTSSDGLRWTRQDVPSLPPLNSISFGDGIFVASGESVEVDGPKMQSIATSTDGVNWTLRNSGTRAVYGVVFGAGQFIGVAGSNFIVSSADGVTWKPRDTGHSEVMLAVTYGNNLFVAVGHDPATGPTNVLTSTDGITWIGHRSGTLQFLRGVSYAAGQYVAVGYGGTILTSTDGVDWTLRSSAGGAIEDVVYGSGRFVVVGGDILTSPDGVAWTSQRTSVTSDSLTGVTFAKGRFVSVGGSFAGAYGVNTAAPMDPDRGIILNSLDGVAWIKTLETPHRLYEVSFANERFVSVGGAGAILTSTNGMDWTEADSTTTNALRGVTYGNGQFLAVGEKGTVVISPDAVTWRAQNSITNALFDTVTFGNGQFVAAGYTSRGSAWNVNGYGVIFTSPDGVNWTPRHGDYIPGLFGVAYGNGLFVAAAYQGTLMTSPDGVNWSRRYFGFQTPFQSVTYGREGFIAAGAGLVMTSKDGLNWTRRNASGVCSFSALAYGPDTVVGVGGSTILQSGRLPMPQLVGGRMAGGAFEFSTEGVGPGVYRIQCAPSMAGSPWTDLGMIANPVGRLLFNDSNAASLPMRFYRLVYEP